MFPEVWAKKTSHSKPRYMFYMPGFNPCNGCWLNGDWVYVSEEQYKKESKKHNQLFSKVKKESKTQHYRDQSIPLKDLTEAQKKAYEHFSGESTLYAYRVMSDKDLSKKDITEEEKFLHLHKMDMVKENRLVFCVRVRLSGKNISEKSIKWIRENGYKIIPMVSNYGKTTDQLKGIKRTTPKDIIADEKDVIDTTAAAIKQNNNQEDLMATEFLKNVDTCDIGIDAIIRIEEYIIKAEWEKSIGKSDMYDDVKKMTQRYKKLREIAISSLGKNTFMEYYQESKSEHNGYEKEDLEKGFPGYVLPEFHDDGTHEAWGPKDVPNSK